MPVGVGCSGARGRADGGMCGRPRADGATCWEQESVRAICTTDCDCLALSATKRIVADYRPEVGNMAKQKPNVNAAK